jgi:hypothetical protein
VGKVCVAVALAFLLAPRRTFAQHYLQTNLTTDPASGLMAANPDKNLLNPWGMARSTGGPWWISDNNSGLSTV